MLYGAFAALVFALAGLIVVFAFKLPYLMETDRLWKTVKKED